LVRNNIEHPLVAQCGGRSGPRRFADRALLVGLGLRGGPLVRPTDVERLGDPDRPLSVTKRTAEDLASIYRRSHGLDVVVARLFNLIGPGEDERHLAPSLARQFAERMAGVTAEPVQVGPLDTTRDFVDVRDVAAALIAISESDAAGDLVNVASGIETGTRSVFETLCRLSGRRAGRSVARPPPRLRSAVRRHLPAAPWGSNRPIRSPTHSRSCSATTSTRWPRRRDLVPEDRGDPHGGARRRRGLRGFADRRDARTLTLDTLDIRLAARDLVNLELIARHGGPWWPTVPGGGSRPAGARSTRRPEPTSSS
jgi:hypothetical protein